MVTPEDLIQDHIRFKRDRYWLAMVIVLLIGKTVYDEGWGIPGAVDRQVKREVAKALERKLDDDLISVFRNDARVIAKQARDYSGELQALLSKWKASTPVFNGTRLVFKTTSGHALSLSSSDPPVIGGSVKEVERDYPLIIHVISGK